MAVMVVVVFILLCIKPSHAPITIVLVKVHVEKLMAIVVLCESAQQVRALMMILHHHKTLSMISMMLSQCSILYASETSHVLSPVLFCESLFLILYI